ncbi:MAG: porin [Planctomycetaceae bacterium]
MKSCLVLLLLSIVLFPELGTTRADDVTFETLLQRLHDTEQRLQNLERDKSSTFRNASFNNNVNNNLPFAFPLVRDESQEKAGDKPFGDEPGDEKKAADSKGGKAGEKNSDEKKGDGQEGDGDRKPDEDEDEEPSFDERLKKLEEGWKELDEAWTSFDKAEKKKKADAAKKPTFKLNGRIHADFWDFLEDDGGVGFLENPIAGDGSDTNPLNDGLDPEDRFAFRRIRLEMGGDILETMLWRTQIDFNNPGTPEMKDVYFGFKELPYNQQLLIGNQKRPLGLDHLNSSRYNVFTERPFVVEAFNEDARRPGICMYGYTDDERYHWRYGAFYLENIVTDGQYLGDQRQMSGNFRLSSSPWYDDTSDGRGYFHWAFAGMFAKPDGTDNGADVNSNEARFRHRPEARSSSRWLNTGRIPGAEWYEIVAVESIFNVGPLQVVGEYQHNFMQRPNAADLQFPGGYVYVSYMLTGEHIPYERTSGTLGRLKPFENFFFVDRCGGGHATGWGAWGVAARYSYLDLSDADILGGVGESATLALNWYWTAYSKVQFNLIYGDIENRDPATGTTSASYLIAGTRFAVEF